MTWLNPVPYTLVPTDDTDSYRDMPEGHTGLPLAPHPGAYGVRRRCHVHEGVDLYVPEGTEVRAVEDGRIIGTIAFTGPSAEPASPWWHDTDALLVRGTSGTVVYGEIAVEDDMKEGDLVSAGQLLGRVVKVLTKATQRPAAMLHLEIHEGDVHDAYEWPLDGPKPSSLRDPTPFLLESIDHER